MAARRLAISSLLCADDELPQSSSPPQPQPPSPRFSQAPTYFSPPSLPQHASQPHRVEEYGQLAHAENAVFHNHESVNLADATGAGRDVVPLSLQPVHLRRHTPSPQYCHERAAAPLSSLVGPAVHPAHTVDQAGYHHRHQQPQLGLSRHQQPEQYQQHFRISYSPPSTSYSMTRPTSSRSTHSDTAPTAPLVAHPYSHTSPVHRHSPSPSSIYSLPPPLRHPSDSPVLSVMHPVSSSPVNHYRPSHSQSSYVSSPPQPYHQSQHLSGPAQMAPGSSSPAISTSPTHHTSSAWSAQHRTTTYGFPEPPRTPRTTSAAALPKILSPISPPRSAGGLGGLEALVQAATEERRRLSGELPSGIHPGRDSSPRVSTSPDIGRGREASQPRIYQRPISPSNRVLVGPAYSSDGLWRDGEPPLKKRRSSGAYTSVPEPETHPRVSPTASSAPLPDNQVALNIAFENRFGELPSLSSNTVHYDSTIEGYHRSPVDGLPDKSGHDVQMDRVTHSDIQGSELGDGSVAAPRERKGKQSVDTSVPRKKEKSAFAQPDAVEYDNPLSEGRSAREQNPHDWLLEQATFLPKAPQQGSPMQDRKPTLVSRPQLANGQTHRTVVELSSPVDLHIEAKKKPKTARARTRTPTPVSILEQELANTPVPKPETQDPDISLELSLAAPASADTSHAAKDDPMDLDVEDELLSLLDDKPRTSHGSAKHSSSAASHHDSRHRFKQAQSSKAEIDTHSPQSGLPDLRVVSERESMPPPASTSAGHLKESAKGADRSESVGMASGQKKKDGAQPAHKPKAPAKPKTKASVKPKLTKDVGAPPASASPITHAAAVAASVAKNKKASPLPNLVQSAGKRFLAAAAGPSRSRSASVMPAGSAGPEADSKKAEDVEDPEDEGAADDKLYCVCKTKYDEDRVMIACDRCDEWYHTQCVDMPDLEVDLVDQFICPPCIASNPQLSLKTTYKRRCLRGLKHPNPSSPSACHKPARGVFSKYCSDECGVLYMQVRIDTWGGDKRRLWESVKGANRREGVVVRVKEESRSPDDADGQAPPELSSEVVKPSQSKLQREAARFRAQLDKIAVRREELKKEMEVVLWRKKLLDLATDRASHTEQCGWDQRLCFGDEEYAEFGAGVLESYEDQGAGREDGDAMLVDGAAEEGEWWCKGKKKCDRHAGWMKLRSAEISFDKETKESALLKLTTEEREIRRKIEDFNGPKARPSAGSAPTSPLQPLNGKGGAVHVSKLVTNGDTNKKGKKKT